MRLIELDEVAVENCNERWMSMISSTSPPVFAADYPQLFARIKLGKGYGSLKERLNESIFYGVEDGNCGEIVAVVETVHARLGKDSWLKMLDIVMSPEIELSTDTEVSTSRRLDVFKASLHGLFEVSKDVRNASTFKIYGRTELLIAFLHGMHDAISTISSIGMLSGIEVAIEGRWLVFRVATH